MKKQKKSESQKTQPTDLNKLTVHDLIANLMQFVHYVDEYLKLIPDNKHIGLIDITILKKKCKDIQQLMNDNFYKVKL